MVHLYPIQKKATLFLSIGILSSLLSFGQLCGPVVEDFNTIANGMAGFSSSTQGFPASPGFVYGNNGPEGFLERCNTTANTTYQIVTRTFQTSPTQTSLGFGFELSGAVQASTVYFFLDYITPSGAIISNYIAAATPVYVANTATICMDVPFSSIPGFVPGGRYRLNIFLLVPTSSNNNQCIRFDNFRTTGTESQIILPVSFTGIIARKAGNYAEVIWNVAGEKEVSHYEVERSTDAKNYTKIGEVTANGSSSYSFTDQNPGNSVVYYRVRNIDLDGRFSYSKVVSLNLSRTVKLNAYPQPVGSELTIDHNLASNGRIVIASAAGQVVKTVQVKTGVTQTTINVSSLSTGMYVVRFDNGQGLVESIKMVKQ